MDIKLSVASHRLLNLINNNIIMKKTIILFALVTILFSCGKDDNITNPPGTEFYYTVFDKTYDISTGFSDASDVLESTQGGYLVAGRSKTGTINSAALLRLDENGNQLWDRIYANGRSLHSVIEVKGGGYAAVGGVSSGAYIVRTDNDGLIIWEATHIFDYADNARKIIQTADGGFLVIANSNATTVNARLIKLSGNGVQSWVQIIGGDPTVKIYSVKENADSTISLIGTSKTFSQPVSWYIKLDKNGNEIVRISIDLSVVELGYTFFEYSVHQNSLNNYAGCGADYFFLINPDGVLVTKNAIEPKEHYENVTMYSLSPTLNNGFIACGFQSKYRIIDSTYFSQTSASLFVFNSEGIFSNSLIIGDTLVNNSATSVIEAKDNSVISAGYKSVSDSKVVIWVKKIRFR